jgi:hypothetical protein
MEYNANDLTEYISQNPPLPNNYSGDCFACKNPSGLNLKFWYLNGLVFTKYRIPSKYRGFQSLGHGGIIATLLDEVSAWTICANLKRLGVTQHFSLNYLKPIYINEDILIEGKIGSHEKSHVIIHSHIKSLDNRILVESNSTWTLPNKEMLANLFRTSKVEVEQILSDFFDPIEEYLLASK